ncbi:MAG: dephospho-CoA kinase [Erysipelotrichaceae bacterium]|nr:dephospho-CoA kinase [Erysipelotrichaceae bacterium]
MRIAVTGTIGSGKSAVCKYLNLKGYDVFDCDEVNRRLLNERANELLYSDFKDCFTNSRLDKKKLSSIVFDCEEERIKLESIMHPEILKELLERKDDPLFAEVPLLFEAGWNIYFDESWLVVCDEDIAYERLLERGVENDEARRRIDVQMSVEQKIIRADRIIYNNGSKEDLYKEIDKLIEGLC